MRARPSILAAALPLLGLTFGCSPGTSVNPTHDAGPPDVMTPQVEPTRAIFVVPESLAELADERFFDQPWPSDLRLEAGSPRLVGFPNPRALPLLASYVETMTGVLDGFSPAASGFLRFTGPIDPATLPASPSAALDPGASVQLVDIDPTSPERGSRRLISLSWREEAGVYLQPNTLSFLPTYGFPLRPHTRYALVVTTRVHAKDGTALRPSEDLERSIGVQGASGATAQASVILAPAITELEAQGVLRGEIASLAVFTTADPVGELFAFADDLKASVPAPTADPAAWKLNNAMTYFDEYLGVYGPSPNYQHGAIPFEQPGDGGQFQLKDGKPELADTFDLRFSLAVPKVDVCPMPPGGYPIVLYAHSTGGYYRTYLHDGTASSLAKRCIATMGIDQLFHGTRPGAPPAGSEGKLELLSFNFQNVVAARTNARQSALDEVQRARLFTESHLTVPAQVSVTGVEIAFDGDNLGFFGHSQGGLNGALFLAADDAARGGVLAGSAAVLAITLLEKTAPAPSVAMLVKSILLGLDAEEGAEVSAYHPAISLAQTLADVVDSVHYARHTVLEPRPGFAAKSVYMVEGVNPDGHGDDFSPPHGIEAHAVALGLPLQLPGQHPILESQYGGPQGVVVPPEGLFANLAGGTASGVLAQWAVPAGQNGHTVVFDVTGAKRQAALFCRNLADNPKGLVPPP